MLGPVDVDASLLVDPVKPEVVALLGQGRLFGERSGRPSGAPRTIVEPVAPWFEELPHARATTPATASNVKIRVFMQIPPVQPGLPASSYIRQDPSSCARYAGAR